MFAELFNPEGSEIYLKPASDYVVEYRDVDVRTLFEVGLRLAGDGPPDDRLRDARTGLDQLVADLRARVLERVQGDGVVH